MNIKAKVYKKEIAGAPTVKALASITIDDSIAIRNIRIIEGKNGLFVSMPNRKLPNGEYSDIAFPITAEARQQITDVILKEYNGQKEEEQKELIENVDLPF